MTTGKGKGRGNRKVDWTRLRNLYLNSDMDLYELSWEKTQSEDYPVWDTLRKRASSEGWKIAKSEKDAKAILLARGTGTDKIKVTGELKEARDKLIDAKLTILRHTEVADGFLEAYLKMLPKMKTAMINVDLSIYDEDPVALSTFIKNMQAIAKDAIEIERRAMNLADLKIDIVREDKVTLTPDKQDLSGLSDADLAQKYFSDLKDAANE